MKNNDSDQPSGPTIERNDPRFGAGITPGRQGDSYGRRQEWQERCQSEILRSTPVGEQGMV